MKHRLKMVFRQNVSLSKIHFSMFRNGRGISIFDHFNDKELVARVKLAAVYAMSSVH